jgi:L-ascorbate metabolism protein UlaG (beta-lactamase superfamily)
MNITYHGHSCFEIETPKHRIVIDPFLSGNPLAKAKPEEIKADWILLTHGHDDHVGDTVDIAKRNQATVIAPHELAVWLGFQGVNAHGMSIGGGYAFDFGHVKMVNALHGSGFVKNEEQQIIYLGPPSGFVLTLEGKTIYHAGDTALYSDMKLIGSGKEIDLALLPIGDNFTMGPEDALTAAEWIGAKHVIPMHYNTFPPIRQDAGAFVEKLHAKGIGGSVLGVGETFTL